MRTLLVGTDIKYEVQLSDIDYDDIARMFDPWCITNMYNKSKKKYPYKHVNKKMIWMHKLVLERTGVVPPSALHWIGDHMDGNTLNCQRNNLRWATVQMNAKNIHGIIVRQYDFGF